MPLKLRRRQIAVRLHASHATRLHHFRPRLERLEPRTLLSAMSLVDEVIAEPLSFSPLAGAGNTAPRGYTPSQIRQAYGFDQIYFGGGTVKGDGTGQTIAIVAAYDHPTIESDLRTFSAAFGLPDVPNFKKINQDGGTNMPSVDATWAREIALDVEWAHAMAPGANILLVEAFSARASDLLAAVNTARNYPGVSVVSMSFGAGEFIMQSHYDVYFTTPPGHAPVTFVAAAGDSGAQAVWPAISSSVISVGGTSLTVAGGTPRESAWSRGGGGYSQYIAQPDYQRGVQSSGMRTSPDVSYVASPQTGLAIYNTVPIDGRTGWFQIGGTSAGAPQWAALVAIVDQGRTLSGEPLLGNGHEALYGLPDTSFRDVTIGSNGYAAGLGYDLVTGRGSPNAAAIVRELVGATTAIAPTPAPIQSPPAAPTPTPAPTPSPTPTPAPPTYSYRLAYFNRRWWIVRIAPASVAAAEPADDIVGGIALSVSIVTAPQQTPSTAAAQPSLVRAARQHALGTESPLPSAHAASVADRISGMVSRPTSGEDGDSNWQTSEFEFGGRRRVDDSRGAAPVRAGATGFVAPARLDDELNGAGRNPLERPSAPIDGATADACFEGFEGSESAENDEPSALFSLSLSLRREIDFAILALSVGIASGTRRRHGPCEDPRRAVPQVPSPGDE